MKRLMVLCLVVITVVLLVGCGETNNISNEASVNSLVDDGDPFTFEKVAELKSAIKKQPSQYEDKQVTVKGGIFEIQDYTALSNICGSGVKFGLEALKQPYIKIVMSEEVKHSLLEEGDYVKIIGTVKITDDEIYLDNCTYEMIETVYE